MTTEKRVEDLDIDATLRNGLARSPCTLPEAPLCHPCRAHCTDAHSPKTRSCSWTTEVQMAARHRMALVAWRRSAAWLEQCSARCRMAAAAQRVACCRTWPRWGREVCEGGERWQRRPSERGRLSVKRSGKFFSRQILLRRRIHTRKLQRDLQEERYRIRVRSYEPSLCHC